MNGLRLVTKWVWRFVGRPPNEQDCTNGAAIDAGVLAPMEELAQILACDECFARWNGTAESWLGMMFTIIAGRAMTTEDYESWSIMLAMGDDYDRRLPLARQFLAQHPYYAQEGKP